MLHDCIIEPHSERVVYVGADDFGACPREVMFDADPEKAGRQGVASVPCFVMSDIGNRMPVLISNASAESVKYIGTPLLVKLQQPLCKKPENSTRSCVKAQLKWMLLRQILRTLTRKGC